MFRKVSQLGEIPFIRQIRKREEGEKKNRRCHFHTVSQNLPFRGVIPCVLRVTVLLVSNILFEEWGQEKYIPRIRQAENSPVDRYEEVSF